MRQASTIKLRLQTTIVAKALASPSQDYDRMIITYAPKWSIIYDCKIYDRKCLQYRPLKKQEFKNIFENGPLTQRTREKKQ